MRSAVVRDPIQSTRSENDLIMCERDTYKGAMDWVADRRGPWGPAWLTSIPHDSAQAESATTLAADSLRDQCACRCHRRMAWAAVLADCGATTRIRSLKRRALPIGPTPLSSPRPACMSVVRRPYAP